MNARFAELCRDEHLALAEPEKKIAYLSATDGLSAVQRAKECSNDIYVGVFFDGTNNNKFRDTPNFGQTVAGLYEVFPGTHAGQTEPVLEPKINADQRSTTPRPIFADRAFAPDSVPAHEFQYYRKIYVPGLGTPMPDVGDGRRPFDQTLGLAFAAYGEERLRWATLQLLNQLHAAIFGAPIEPFVRVNKTTVFSLERHLKLQLKRRGDRKPVLRKIRLSVFGFSRGAATARAWVTDVVSNFGASIADIPLQIDFMGLFDSVASVGPGPAAPFSFAGRWYWGGPASMIIPGVVKRCVHLVAGLEVRASFPVDSVSQGGRLPFNCKEIVYPGVHSDVGGGYAPGEQGRACGAGAEGDKRKISQIPLAQMYREARMAGVPLAPDISKDTLRAPYFAIDLQLREDFNAYVRATSVAPLSVVPSDGTGDETWARMYPTETQPRETLFQVMRTHYGILTRWRRDLLDRPGGIAALPELELNHQESRYQDIEDLRGAEEELRSELILLQHENTAEGKKLKAVLFRTDPMDGVIDEIFFHDNFLSKKRQWRGWIQQEWDKSDPEPVRTAAERLFRHYVHDSRAWFKPDLAKNMWQQRAPTDEDWFVYGGRERMRASLLKQAASLFNSPRQKDRAEGAEKLRALEQPGAPLIQGAREPFWRFGYLTNRHIYESGIIQDKNWSQHQERVIHEEAQRASEVNKAKVRQELMNEEVKAYEVNLASIAAIKRNGMASQATHAHPDEFLSNVKRLGEIEEKRHADALESIRLINFH